MPGGLACHVSDATEAVAPEDDMTRSGAQCTVPHLVIPRPVVALNTRRSCATATTIAFVTPPAP
jgi:hypothetical protein